MITNEVQYRATKAHLERFEQASTNLTAKPGERTKLEQLELDAVNAQGDDLRAEIVEYERLRSGEQVSFAAGSLAELATVLVKARVARGWTNGHGGRVAHGRCALRREPAAHSRGRYWLRHRTARIGVAAATW